MDTAVAIANPSRSIYSKASFDKHFCCTYLAVEGGPGSQTTMETTTLTVVEAGSHFEKFVLLS
jgi:hypothetical protein